MYTQGSCRNDTVPLSQMPRLKKKIIRLADSAGAPRETRPRASVPLLSVTWSACGACLPVIASMSLVVVFSSWANTFRPARHRGRLANVSSFSLLRKNIKVKNAARRLFAARGMARRDEKTHAKRHRSQCFGVSLRKGRNKQDNWQNRT